MTSLLLLAAYSSNSLSLSLSSGKPKLNDFGCLRFDLDITFSFAKFVRSSPLVLLILPKIDYFHLDPPKDGSVGLSIADSTISSSSMFEVVICANFCMVGTVAPNDLLPPDDLNGIEVSSIVSSRLFFPLKPPILTFEATLGSLDRELGIF